MTEAPERIHGWQHNQMSVARHYGGLRYMGHEYTIAFASAFITSHRTSGVPGSA